MPENVFCGILQRYLKFSIGLCINDKIIQNNEYGMENNVIFKIRCNEKTMEQSGVTGSLEHDQRTRPMERTIFFRQNRELRTLPNVLYVYTLNAQ
jgi:hypothetical protein